MESMIELVREIVETATCSETFYGRLKGVALDWAGIFPTTIHVVGRSIWYDGDSNSVFVEHGRIGCRISYYRPTDILVISPISYRDLECELITLPPEKVSLSQAREYLMFF